MTSALTHPADTYAPDPVAPRRRRDRDATAGISATELLARYSEAGFDTPVPGGRRADRTGGAPSAGPAIPAAPAIESIGAPQPGPSGADATVITHDVTPDVPAGTSATGAIGLLRGRTSETGAFGRNPRAVAATMSATLVGATAVMGVVAGLGEPSPQDAGQGVDLAGVANENTLKLDVPAAGAQNGGAGTSEAATSLGRGFQNVTAAVPQAFEQADAARIAAVAHKQAAEKAAEERARAAEQAGRDAGAGAGRGAGDGAGDGAGEDAGPSSGSGAGAQALSEAKSQLGKPYKWGATGPNAFDCSGLMVWAFDQLGVDLPRTSQAQSQMDGEKVSKSDLQPGDIVFFYSPVSHVGLYAGNGKILHASTSGEPVKYSDIDAMPFHSAKRI